METREPSRRDDGSKRAFIVPFAGFVFARDGSLEQSDLLQIPRDVVVVFEDYSGPVGGRNGGTHEGKQNVLPPVVSQLGREASLLAVCILRKYVFNPEPPPHSLSRSVLQSLLNLAFEYIPQYVEKMYWLEVAAEKSRDPGVKLYLASLLRSFDLFLLDFSHILTNAQKQNKRFRSESVTLQRDIIVKGFFGILAARRSPCIHQVDQNLTRAKVTRVKALYNARVQSMFGDVKHWQAGLWMSSTVKSIAPLIVSIMDRYATPYSIAVVLDRMLDVLIESGESDVPREVVEEIKKPHVMDQQAFGKVVYTSVAEETRISNMYGALISSITTTLLSVVELTGLFRVVLQAAAKPLKLLFEKSIGAALNLALESSTEDDLRKVRFAMRMLFGDAAAASINKNGPTEASVNKVEDLLSSAFDQGTMDELAELMHQSPIQFLEDPFEAERFVAQFYEKQCVLKLERVILLELSKKSKAVAKLSGDYIRQVLNGLVSTVSLVLRDPLLLDVLVWDYVLLQLLSSPN